MEEQTNQAKLKTFPTLINQLSEKYGLSHASLQSKLGVDEASFKNMFQRYATVRVTMNSAIVKKIKYVFPDINDDFFISDGTDEALVAEARAAQAAAKEAENTAKASEEAKTEVKEETVGEVQTEEQAENMINRFSTTPEAPVVTHHADATEATKLTETVKEEAPAAPVEAVKEIATEKVKAEAPIKSEEKPVKAQPKKSAAKKKTMYSKEHYKKASEVINALLAKGYTLETLAIKLNIGINVLKNYTQGAIGKETEYPMLKEKIGVAFSLPEEFYLKDEFIATLKEKSGEAPANEKEVEKKPEAEKKAEKPVEKAVKKSAEKPAVKNTGTKKIDILLRPQHEPIEELLAKGETLESIAEKTGLTVKSIKLGIKGANATSHRYYNLKDRLVAAYGLPEEYFLLNPDTAAAGTDAKTEPEKTEVPTEQPKAEVIEEIKAETETKAEPVAEAETEVKEEAPAVEVMKKAPAPKTKAAEKPKASKGKKEEIVLAKIGGGMSFGWKREEAARIEARNKQEEKIISAIKKVDGNNGPVRLRGNASDINKAQIDEWTQKYEESLKERVGGLNKDKLAENVKVAEDIKKKLNTTLKTVGDAVKDIEALIISGKTAISKGIDYDDRTKGKVTGIFDLLRSSIEIASEGVVIEKPEEPTDECVKVVEENKNEKFRKLVTAASKLDDSVLDLLLEIAGLKEIDKKTEEVIKAAPKLKGDALDAVLILAGSGKKNKKLTDIVNLGVTKSDGGLESVYNTLKYVN